jgi:hypothetical protein
MANSLNSNNDAFIFNFPTTFVPKDIEEKYDIFLKNHHLPYASLVDYLNHTIKEITLPAMTFPVVTQTKYYGKKREHRGSTSPYDLYARDFTMNIKSVDSHVNYLIIMDCLIYHYIKLGQSFIDDFTIIMLDATTRTETYRIYLREILSKGFSDLRLSNSQGNEQDEKDVTISFSCNYLDIEFIPHYGQDTDDAELFDNYYDQLNKNDPEHQPGILDE